MMWPKGHAYLSFSTNAPWLMFSRTPITFWSFCNLFVARGVSPLPLEYKLRETGTCLLWLLVTESPLSMGPDVMTV